MPTNQDPQEDSSKQSAGESLQITPQSNWAVKVWLFIVVLVLCLLWFETRNSNARDYNLLLNGDSDTIGAQVFIDGKPSGTMSRSAGSDLGGGAYWAKVTDGRHLVDVQKKGYKPFRRDVTIRGQGYVGVELLPQQAIDGSAGSAAKSTESSPEDAMDMPD